YFPPPILYADSLYPMQHYPGFISRLDIKTGEDQGGPFRLDAIDDVDASPVGAAGRIYVTSRDGVTQVMSHGDQILKMLAVNRLGDNINASAALAGRELFLRGERFLYCIVEE